MTREKTVTVHICDGCGKDCDYPASCLKCGKNFCYDCRKTKAVGKGASMTRETSYSVGAANHERRALISASCQAHEANGLCMEAPEYCRKCETCKEPFCEDHRVEIGGVAYCLTCAKSEMDLEEAADALIESEAA